MVETIGRIVPFPEGYMIFFRSNMCIHANMELRKEANELFAPGRRSMVLFACKYLLKWWADREGIVLSLEDFCLPRE